jgi:hypothetical protein
MTEREALDYFVSIVDEWQNEDGPDMDASDFIDAIECAAHLARTALAKVTS